MTVLVVDDEEVVARPIAALLERWDVSAGYAVDVRSVMARANRATPRSVILEERLGYDTGMDLPGWFQSRMPEAQIVVMTGHGDIGIVVKAMRPGAQDFRPNRPTLPSSRPIRCCMVRRG